MEPSQSYVLWFSQRVGSTVLAQALEDTDIAGRPREWFTDAAGIGLLAKYHVRDVIELRERLWREATSPNGVLGLKYGMQADEHRRVNALLAGLVADDRAGNGRAAWNTFFPECKHVFVTRRDKVRIAVSWWRAIKTGEWHRPCRPEPTAVDGAFGRTTPDPASPNLIDLYDYDAIEHLAREASIREADIQAQLDDWEVTPYTIAYEDLVAHFAPTVRALLEFLGIPGGREVPIPEPALARMADETSEAWYQRFRREWTEKTQRDRAGSDAGKR